MMAKSTWRLLLGMTVSLLIASVTTSLAQDQSSAELPSDRVARLTDAEVRALLLRELEEKAATSGNGSAANPAVTSIQIQQQISWLRDRLGEKICCRR